MTCEPKTEEYHAHPRSPSSAPARPACCSASCCTRAGIDNVDPRAAHAATTCSAASAPACWSRARSTCSTKPASARACTPRACARRHRDRLGRRPPPHRPERPDRRQDVIVYGQTEVTRDLMDARAASGARRRLRGRGRAACTTSTATARRALPARRRRTHELDCDFIAGCDGFHGVCRQSVPRDGDPAPTSASIRSAGSACSSDTPPVSDELIYVQHERGFALC